LIQKLVGVHAYLVTPFTENDEVDIEGLIGNTRFLEERGVSIVVPAGGTGEFDSLTQMERREAIGAVLESSRGETVVIAPVGGSLKDAIELAEYAEDKKGEFLIVRPPKITARDDGLLDYYRKIIERVSLGVIIHRLPGAAASFEVIRQLADLEKVVAVKDEAEDIHWFREMAEALGNRLLPVCGGVAGGEMDAPFYYTLGARAFSSGVVNFIPELPLQLHDALMAGDYATAHELRKKLGPLQELRSRRERTNSIPVIKEALDLLGLRGGPLRPPLSPLIPEDKDDLREILMNLGLLS
jgi:dihydrodipicolinate synthase/N-acetylneuraminate lyase